MFNKTSDNDRGCPSLSLSHNWCGKAVFEMESHITMLVMRKGPLNKSNKIDVTFFFSLGDNLRNSATTNGMGKQVTRASNSLSRLWACKKWQILEMCHKFWRAALTIPRMTAAVTSMNIESLHIIKSHKSQKPSRWTRSLDPFFFFFCPLIPADRNKSTAACDPPPHPFPCVEWSVNGGGGASWEWNSELIKKAVRWPLRHGGTHGAFMTITRFNSQ